MIDRHSPVKSYNFESEDVCTCLSYTKLVLLGDMKLKTRIVWTVVTLGSIVSFVGILIYHRVPLPAHDVPGLFNIQSHHKWIGNVKKLFNRNTSNTIGKHEKPAHGIVEKQLYTLPLHSRNRRKKISDEKGRDLKANNQGSNHGISRNSNVVAKPSRPSEHISFLKVHMLGSTSLQLLFFRFGYTRNLSFVIPETGHYFTKSTSSHEPIIPPTYGGHYDIVCNHACFNASLYATVLPKDSIYLASVMRPYEQFVHSYYYYSRFSTFRYLQRLPEPKIENLIKYPQRYDESCLSYTMNSMARDFGFLASHFHELTMKSANEYLKHISGVFDLVLVYERYDESIVLMRRLLKWPLKSILYLPEKIDTPDINVPSKLMTAFRVRNRLDYLIYDHFSKVMEDKIQEGGKDLREETINFKMIQRTVRTWCFEVYFGKITIPATRWSEQFDFDSKECELLGKSEFEFMELLRGKS